MIFSPKLNYMATIRKTFRLEEAENNELQSILAYYGWSTENEVIKYVIASHMGMKNSISQLTKSLETIEQVMQERTMDLQNFLYFRQKVEGWGRENEVVEVSPKSRKKKE